LGGGEAFADAIMSDYRTADLSPPDRIMLEFAEKLTRTPASVSSEDIDKLRQADFDDDAIHDIVQVTALFNYYGRLADGLGIEPEPEWKV
jgi:uncharacterized peroxidase-related enzyme